MFAVTDNKKLAVLGAGKMGGALAAGIVRGGAIASRDIAIYDAQPSKAAELAAEIGGARAATSAADAVNGADIILLAVKPQVVAPVLKDLGHQLTTNHLVISIAAGVQIATMEALVPAGVPIIRVMPNTPALVGAGASSLTAGTSATAEHIALAETLLRVVGVTVVVDEKLVDAVTGLSGSGPAYVYMIIEALTDGGVNAGLPRDIARKLAAQTVYGGAKMVLDTGAHTGQLKDDVTTPGGTTITALASLERAGVRGALIDAVLAATNRSKEMGKS